VRGTGRALSGPSPSPGIREADGRYYVSFVVERGPVPLPPAAGEVWVDLGLDRFGGHLRW
jgi:putative transposase